MSFMCTTFGFNIFKCLFALTKGDKVERELSSRKQMLQVRTKGESERWDSSERGINLALWGGIVDYSNES